MKAKITRSAHNYQVIGGHLFLNRKPLGFETNTQPSMTEPNQVQDLKTLIIGRNRGIVPTFFNGKYSEYDTEDIQKMDFIELRDYRDRVAAQAEQLENEFKALTNQMEQVRARSLEQRLQTILDAKEALKTSSNNPNP